MGSKKKKADKVELSYEEVKEKFVQTKEALAEKRKEMGAFLKENKLKKTQDHSSHKDKKIASAYKKIKKAISDLEEERNSLKQTMAENKPKSERPTKYNYPEGLDAEQRKKFRAGIRAKAKKAGVTPDEYLSDPEKYDAQVKESKASKKKTKKEAKEETPKKGGKKTSKKKKEEAPEEEEKPAKKKKAKKSKND